MSTYDIGILCKNKKNYLPYSSLTSSKNKQTNGSVQSMMVCILVWKFPIGIITRSC